MTFLTGLLNSINSKAEIVSNTSTVLNNAINNLNTEIFPEINKPGQKSGNAFEEANIALNLYGDDTQ
ncbi:hypothetical protein IJ531_06770, partial [bacterium]|nr:hypothetical protein [bacterium]